MSRPANYGTAASASTPDRNSRLKLKQLDGLELFDGLPTDEVEHNKLYTELTSAHPLPAHIVHNPTVGGIFINQGEFAVAEYTHPEGTDYDIVTITGRFRSAIKPLPNHHVNLLGPFSLQGNEVIEFGQRKQRVIQIPPGKIGFYSYNGNVYPLFSGNYWLKSPMITYLGSESLNQDVMKKNDAFSILRIPEGHFACYQDVNGNIRELRAEHNDNSEVDARYILRRGQKFLGLHSNTASVVHGEDGRYQRVFLKAGEIAFYTDRTGQTRVMNEAGPHVLTAPESFEKRLNGNIAEIVIHQSTERCMKFGAIEIVNLKDGEVAFYTDKDGTTKYFDKPGRHVLDTPAFFEKQDGSIAIHNSTDSLLQYGSIAIVNLKQGEATYKYDENMKAILILKEGRHVIDLTKERLSTEGVVPITAPTGKEPSGAWSKPLGPFEIVNVPPNHVAITVRSTPGQRPTIETLETGCIILDDPNWRLQSIRSLQERRIDLGQQTTGKRFCEVYTNDRVRFNVTSFLLFKVVNASKAYVEVQDIEDVLRREAESMLVNLFGKHQAAEITQGVNAKLVEQKKPTNAAMDEVFAGLAPSFTESLMGEFTREFEKFAAARGVELTRMRVEELDFSCPEMKRAVEDSASQMQKMHVELQIAEQQRQLDLKKAEAAVAAQLKATDGQLSASLNTAKTASELEQIKAQQDAQAKIIAAKAEADAMRMRAEADAAVRIRQAQAEAEAIKLVADAKASAVQNPILAQVMLMQTYFEGLARVYGAAASGDNLIPTGMTLPGSLLQGNSGMQGFLTRMQMGTANPAFFRMDLPANNNPQTDLVEIQKMEAGQRGGS